MVTTRSMSRDERRTFTIYLDHLRALLASVPVGVGMLASSYTNVSDEGILWLCSMSVPWVWMMMRQNFPPNITTCPFWWYVTLVSARAIMAQAEAFVKLQVFTLPVLVLKLHAILSLLYLSMFIACHLVSNAMNVPRPVVLRPFRRLALVY